MVVVEGDHVINSPYFGVCEVGEYPKGGCLKKKAVFFHKNSLRSADEPRYVYNYQYCVVG